MTDPRIERWAQTLVNYSVNVQPGQTVAITGGIAAEPLMRSIYREVIKAGGFPVALPAFSGLGADLLKMGSDDQLGYISPVERFMREQTDVMIAIMADTNTKAMASVDPARQQFFQGARRELFQTYLRRDAEGLLNWTLTLYPTDAYAQDADMSTEEFAEFVFRACKLHTDDPSPPGRRRPSAQRIVDWLHGKQEIHLTGPGTDLRVSVAGRVWINSDGTKNFPDGEIFTGPVEDGVNGHVRFSFPVVTAGREIEGIVLRFEHGKVVQASADAGQEYLDACSTPIPARASSASSRSARITTSSASPRTSSSTRRSAARSTWRSAPATRRRAAPTSRPMHWDMICDLRQGGEVRADGELLLKDGKFVV